MTIATMCRRYVTNAFMKKAFRSKLQILVLTVGIVILLFFKRYVYLKCSLSYLKIRGQLDTHMEQTLNQR